MRKRIRDIVNNDTTKYGRTFDYTIEFLILVSLIAYAIETLPNNPPALQLILVRIETISVIIFTIECILRIYIAEKPLKYIFSFYGVIDLLAILPFLLGAAIDLRSLRAFRILRVFRAFKLIRYNRALHRFNIAYNIVREEIILFFNSDSYLFVFGLCRYILL